MNGHNHHQHMHDENCSCGHDHTQEHFHGDNCSCGHDHTHDGNISGVQEDGIGVVYTEYHLHDEARVISGRLTVAGAYDAVKKAVSHALEQYAEAVREAGGIVGHIKASCQVMTVEMFSVTESNVSVKTAPQQEIRIILAAIVFRIEPEKAEELARKSLEAVRDSAGI
ncbi:MAG: hypothetical protein GXY05_06180 [Clostridiales bacterium]|nr:hypothetical protein [Clostridiales bacterium]